MATTWTREQEEELAVLYESYKGEEGKRPSSSAPMCRSATHTPSL